MYAFLTDGLDDERREQLDVMLEGNADPKTKARRERQAAEAAMRFMK